MATDFHMQHIIDVTSGKQRATPVVAQAMEESCCLPLILHTKSKGNLNSCDKMTHGTRVCSGHFIAKQGGEAV